MPQINRAVNGDSLPDEAREFRAHLAVLQWDTVKFARAARIKNRSATAMWDGERGVPVRLMNWLRSMVDTMADVPAPPDES
jgi:hypothetical protein